MTQAVYADRKSQPPQHLNAMNVNTQWYADAMDTLVATVKALSHARDMNAIMRIVRRTARELTGADGATFVLKDGTYCHYADEDAIEPLWKGQRFPMSQCISGWVMQNAMSVVIDDVFKDARIPIAAYSKTFVKSMAMVPIRTGDPIGAIGNYWARHYRPSKEELSILQSLADITSLAIENVHLYDLLQTKLRALEESNHELGRFAWMISNELKEPLSAIDKLSQAIEEEMGVAIMPEQAYLQIKQLRQRVQRMEKRLDDVLDYAHLEKKMDPEETNAEISGDLLIQETLVMLGLPSSFTLKVEGCVSDMCVQRMPLQQILCNLIGNTVKHHDQGGGIISVKVEDERVFYRISVTDDGPGISKDIRGTMFEMFQKLGGADHENGSGMGLALTKKILLHYGGNINVETDPQERGTTIQFTWPKPLSHMTAKP